jgi:hypothetical protein
MPIRCRFATLLRPGVQQPDAAVVRRSRLRVRRDCPRAASRRPAAVQHFWPGTLAELRESWDASGDPSNHVNHFFDAHALGSALMHAGLGEPVLDVDRIVMGYPDAMTLMRELKAIGAHNVTRGRAAGLTGRARLTAMTIA